MEILTNTQIILASNGSWGINTNIFETNLINQLIILGGIIFVGRDLLNESLTERQNEIMTGIQDSEKRLEEAKIRLSDAKTQLEQTRVIINQIKKDTIITRKTLLNSDYEQAKSDLARRFSSAKTLYKFQERQVLNEIKGYISNVAFDLVKTKLEKQIGLEEKLSGYLTDSIKRVNFQASVKQ